MIFWKENANKFNIAQIGPKAECSKIVYSDASRTGYGGYVVSIANSNTESHGMWDQIDSNKSSAWRELKAVYLIMKSISHELSNSRVKWFTDNQSVEIIAVKGSMKPDLQNIVLSICRTCMHRNIQLEMEWVPRADSQRADMLSKIIDNDDWQVSDECFHLFENLWGPHSVDRFAS